jgi:heme-degrading monooxygenase HmoA
MLHPCQPGKEMNMNCRSDQWKTLLFADEQNPDMDGILNIFEPLIGAWDLKWTGYYPDGNTQSEMGEWFFFWALEGRILQDLWIIPSLQNRGKEGYPKGEYGTTLRYYDKTLQKWKASWFGPLRNSFLTFTINKTDDEIILESESGTEMQRKWIFSQIQPDSFHWRSEQLRDDNWFLDQEMQVVRKPAMKSENTIIERIWHGWTNHENAIAYEELLKKEIFINIGKRDIKGYISIRLLVRKHEEEVEFITIMRFDSLDAVKAFAGEDYEKSVVPEKARKLLLHFDEKAAHYEIKEELTI